MGKFKGSAEAIALAFAWICTLVSSVGAFEDQDVVVNPVLIKVIEEVVVPAIQEGPILSIQVVEGQLVQTDQPLLQLDDQRARLKQQQAELEQRIAARKAEDRSGVLLAETELRVSNASLQRALDSRKRIPDTPSKAEVEDIELRVAQAKQHLDEETREFQLAELAKELAEKNLELAKYDVARHLVRSPIQGSVTEIIARKGEWVRPGDPLVRVMRIDRLKVEGFLKRDLVSPSLLSRSVTIVVEGAGDTKDTYMGKITFISPVIEPNDRTQRIVAEVDNSKGLLGPGLRAKMIIHSR